MLKQILDNKSQLIGAVALASITVLGASGCGKNANNIVTHVDLKTSVKDNDNWVQMNLGLSTGGFPLAGINIPITNPNDHSKVYGEFTLIPNFCNSNPCNYGGNISVSVNISEISKLPAEPALLPNGTFVPVGNLQNAQMIRVPINDTGAYLYFAFGPGVAMLGTAISFSALDPAGQYVPGANIFQPIQIGPVNLVAGLYTGAAPKTTGVGVFVDLSSVVDQLPHLKSLSANNSNAYVRAMSFGGHPEFRSILQMKSVKPSYNKEYKLYQKLYQLEQRRTILRMQ